MVFQANYSGPSQLDPHACNITQQSTRVANQKVQEDKPESLRLARTLLAITLIARALLALALAA